MGQSPAGAVLQGGRGEMFESGELKKQSEKLEIFLYLFNYQLSEFAILHLTLLYAGF